MKDKTMKETRIRGLIPKYSNGFIIHLEGRTESLENELLRFPLAINDDQSDALAYQLHIAEPPGFVRQRKENNLSRMI